MKSVLYQWATICTSTWDSLLFDSFIQEHIYFICGPTIAVWPLARFGPGPQKHIKPKGHNNWTFIRLEEIWKILIKREIRTWRRSAALRNFLLEFSLKTKVPHWSIFFGVYLKGSLSEDRLVINPQFIFWVILFLIFPWLSV